MEEPDDDTNPSAGRGKKRWIVWAAVIVVLVGALQLLPVGEWLMALESWIESLGFWGPLVFIVLYIIATVLILPGAAMTPLAGLLFGLGWGTLWVVIASNIGASIAFVLGRTLAREAIEKRIGENKNFGASDRAVA
ncbi:MAG: VTT domain-containing protein, partial [Verrucomicrobiota bacterium]